MNKFLRKILFHSSLLRSFLKHLIQIGSFFSKDKKGIGYPKLVTRIIDNEVYGHYRILKMLNIDESYFIEHGVFFGDHIQFDQFCYGKKIVTMGGFRKDLLYQLGALDVKIVGPYIKYFSNCNHFPFLRKVYNDYNLVVFPPHSSNNFQANLNIFNLIEIIQQLQRKYSFTNILVCWYFLDFNPNFQIDNVNIINLTCGNRWDSSFLEKFKEILGVSNLSLSFNVGTHIGYCIQEEIPHTIFNLDWSQKSLNNLSERDMNYKNSSNRINQMNEVYRSFFSQNLNLYESISSIQKNVVYKYWGYNENSK